MRPLPPLVLVEIGDELSEQPVVTKEESVTVVTIDWDCDPPVRDVPDAIRCLSQYEDEHPRIDHVLGRLRTLLAEQS